MIELKVWKYSLGKEAHPMHEITLYSETYHAAARELAKKLDDGEPEQLREVWLLDPKHDTPRQFEVYTVVEYSAYEVDK